MEEIKTVGLNIWQAVNRIKFSYLKPEIIVNPKEFLFLIDEKKGLLIFKTEDDKTVMLPRLTKSAVRVF